MDWIDFFLWQWLFVLLCSQCLQVVLVKSFSLSYILLNCFLIRSHCSYFTLNTKHNVKHNHSYCSEAFQDNTKENGPRSFCHKILTTIKHASPGITNCTDCEDCAMMSLKPFKDHKRNSQKASNNKSNPISLVHFLFFHFPNICFWFFCFFQYFFFFHRYLLM